MLSNRVEEAVRRLQPRLEDLAEGHVELMEVDEKRGVVKLKLVGGRVC